jgi:hypothetical protein
MYTKDLFVTVKNYNRFLKRYSRTIILIVWQENNVGVGIF